MLKALVRHPRQPLSRDKLAQLARGREFEPFDRSLDVQISRLRKMIEPDPAAAALHPDGVGRRLRVRAGRRRAEALTTSRAASATRTIKRSSSTSLSERLRPPQTPRLAKKFVALSLFWRTFFLLALLLASGVFAWVQTFRALEFEPRAIQAAQQIASLVNIAARRAARHRRHQPRSPSSRACRRSSRCKLTPREPTDKWEPFEVDRFQRVIERELRDQLGPDTVVASAMNGTPGLWVGFSIDARLALAAGRPDARRADVDEHHRPAGSRSRCSRPCSARPAIARLINRPLKDLSFAASRIREGEYDSRLDETTMTSEIRQVNMGFNRMARELAKVEQDRAVMLAGISHDLRTPLARLRLEAEMSVQDDEAQGQHGDGHRPARRDHRQVHGLRAAGRGQARAGATVATIVDARGGGVPRHEPDPHPVEGRARHRACSPTTSSSAASCRTCSRTRAATAARPTPASPASSSATRAPGRG